MILDMKYVGKGVLSSFSFVPIISQVLKQLQFTLKGKQILMYCACEHAFSTMWTCGKYVDASIKACTSQLFPKIVRNRIGNAMIYACVVFFAKLVSLGTHDLDTVECPRYIQLSHDIWCFSCGSTGQILVHLNSIPMPQGHTHW